MYSTFEQLQRHLNRTEFSDGFFSSGPPCLCALYVSYSHVFLLLAGFSPWVVVFSTNDGPTFLIRVYCEDNTSQVHFRSVNLYKEFPYRSECEYIWYSDDK